MTIIEQSALLPYSDQQLFDLVNDIESYPKFMQGCVGAEILSTTGDTVTARLDLGKGRLKHSFTTCNTLTAPHKMEMKLVDGPFKKFSACWTFTYLKADACKANLQMEFEFSSGLLDMALKALFDSSCKTLVNAVSKRANLLYG